MNNSFLLSLEPFTLVSQDGGKTFTSTPTLYWGGYHGLLIRGEEVSGRFSIIGGRVTALSNLGSFPALSVPEGTGIVISDGYIVPAGEMAYAKVENPEMGAVLEVLRRL